MKTVLIPWKVLFSEIVTLLFTANIFWSLYKGDGETALIFGLLLIALQIEKLSDKFNERV
jgi:hypothetical protein